MELTEKVLSFQLGHWTWTDLWKGILLDIEKFFRLNCIPDEVALLTVAKLSPRLPTMVGSFNYVGKPFEALLHTALRFQLKSIYAEKKQDRERESLLPQIVWEEAHQSEEMADETSTDGEQLFSGDISQRDILRQQGLISRLKPEQRRHLILAMKNCTHLPDAACVQMSREFGLNLVWLLNCRDELRESARQRVELYRDIQARERRLLFGMHLVTDQSTIPESTRKKLANIQKRLRELHPFPRHEDISAKLGIPKGTVDTSLYYLRKQIAKNQELVLAKKNSRIHDAAYEHRRSQQQFSQNPGISGDSDRAHRTCAPRSGDQL